MIDSGIISNLWNVRTKEARKTKSVLAAKSNQRAGEQTWGEAEKIAINRVRWKALVEAPCLTRSKED